MAAIDQGRGLRTQSGALRVGFVVLYGQACQTGPVEMTSCL
jgi:hypothetical protein